MCGRYGRSSRGGTLRKAFGLTDSADVLPTFNAAPQSTQPVVRLGEDGQREAELMRWGLVPFWAKDAKIGYSTFNARSETVATAPAFREAFRRRRCLVPADFFYEWKKLGPKEKQAYGIGLADGEPYAFAGLCESWKRGAEPPLRSFSILTTDPNELMEGIHTRMPVILKPTDYDRWLDPGLASHPPLDLLRPFDADKMKAWPVSPRVGNVRNDDPTLIVPTIAESTLGGPNSL